MKYFLSTILSLIVIASAFAQGPNQMNFQGALYDNGAPIDGTVNITFTVFDTDNTTPIWTETHSGITVASGYYSVVLGSTNPGTSDLPEDLFYGVDVREMNISVDYNSSVTDLGNIQLFAPLTGNSFSSIVSGDPLDNGTVVNDTSILMYQEGTGNDDGKLNVDLESDGTLTLYGRSASNTYIKSAAQMGQFGNGNSYVNLYGENQAGDGPAQMVDLYTFDKNIQFQNFNNNYRRGGVDFKDNEGNLLTAISGNRDDNGGDPTGQSGWMMTRGTNTPNVEFGGKSWENNDLPFFQFFGSTSDGDTWYQNNLLMEVNTDGTNEWGRISIQNTDTGDPNAEVETINLDGETGTGYFAGDLTVDGSIIGNVDINAIDSIGKDLTGSPKSYGFIATITGDSATAPGFFYDAAVVGEARTDFNNNVGVYGWAEAGDESTDKFQTGVEGFAGGNSPSLKYGVRGIVGGQNSGYTVGGLGYNQAIIPDNGTAHGLYGRVFNGATGATSYGVRGRAQGTGGTNYGIFGEALNGDENWAGWFEGDVKVTGNLDANIGNIGNDAYSIGEKDWEDGTQGFVHLYTNFESGKDNIRAALEVDGPNLDSASGRLTLSGPVYNDSGCTNCPRSFASVSATRTNDNGTDRGDYYGSINLDGMTSPNVQIGANDWADSDAGSIYIYGEQPDGTGWWHSHASMRVDSANGGQWGAVDLQGNNGNSNFIFTSKSWDGLQGINRPYMALRGNNNAYDLVSIQVSDTPYGNREIGEIVLNMDDSVTTNISADWAGFGGNVSVTGNLNSDGDFRAGNNIAVKEGTNTDNNAIEMFESGDAGYMNINNSANQNSISFNGQDGKIDILASGYDPISLQSGPNGGEIFVSDNSGTSWVHFQSEYQQVSFNDFAGLNTFIGPFGLFTGNGMWDISTNDGSAKFRNLSSSNLDVYASTGAGLKIKNSSDSSFNVIYAFEESNYGIIDIFDSSDKINPTISLQGGAGEVYASGVLLTSDERYKTNIKPLTGSLRNVLSLRGVSYNWLDPKKSQDDQIGVIAQEVEEIYPEFVHTNENGYKSVNYAQMSAVLIEAIKELNAEVESLKKENLDLKAQVNKADDLEARLLKLEKLIGVSAGETSNANNN